LEEYSGSACFVGRRGDMVTFFPEAEAYTSNIRALAMRSEPSPNEIHEVVFGPTNEKNMSLLSLATLRVRARLLSLGMKISCAVVLLLAVKAGAARKSTVYMVRCRI